jgi:hypothetical protein
MIIKTLSGNSSSAVSIVEDNGVHFVRKTDNISRNLERYSALSYLNLPFPKILTITDKFYDIEYVKHIDIKTYLLHEHPKLLLDFIIYVIDTLRKTSVEKNYSEIYYNKLQYIDFSCFSFSKDNLMSKLPLIVPKSEYFGDFSFDNILFDLDSNEFKLIDGLTTEYDSYIFDLHKLKQDLICNWFIRKEKIRISHQLTYINDALKQKYQYFDDKYLTILMLLRVLPYCKTNFDKTFIQTQVNKLWI